METSNKKNYTGYIILIIIILILGGYIVINSLGNNNSSSTNAKEDVKEKCPDNIRQVSTVSKYCDGTYPVEVKNINEDGEEVLIKYKYILKKNGEYSQIYDEHNEIKGTYYINGNTLTLMVKVDEKANPDKKIDYFSADYFIAEDCSYIEINNKDGWQKINKE